MEGNILYVADNGPRRRVLLALDLDENGDVSHPRVIHDFGDDRGIDGMTVTTDGWIIAAASSGRRAGAWVFSPEGNVLAIIPTPESPANVEFGKRRNSPGMRWDSSRGAGHDFFQQRATPGGSWRASFQLGGIGSGMSDSSGRGWQVQAGSRCRTADPCVNVKNSHRGTETMHIERRKHPRFKVNEGRVWTGRWSSPSVFETSASLVDNLGLGGARVLTTSAPVVGEYLWIRSARPGKLQTLRAKVLEVQMVNQGNYRVRLEFDTSCSEPFVLCLLLEAPAPDTAFVVCEAVPE